jgi:hypothetical protein
MKFYGLIITEKVTICKRPISITKTPFFIFEYDSSPFLPEIIQFCQKVSQKNIFDFFCGFFFQ